VGGYSVLGTFDRLISLIEKDEVDCVVLNTRIIDVDRLIELEAVCQQTGVSLLKLQINVKPFVVAS